MSRPPAWVAPWVGRPFELGGRGPEAFDCWGLVRAALLGQWGVELPALEGAEVWGLHERLAQGLDVLEDRLTPVLMTRPGDILGFDLDGGHVGLVVSRDWMLHTRERADSSLERFGRLPWRAALEGSWRPRELVRA